MQLSLVAAQPKCYFIVEETVPDTVVCDAGGSRKGAGEVAQQPVRDGSGEEEDDNDEEEEDPTGDNGYENRMARSLEGSSSGTASLNTASSVSTATTALSATESSGNTGAAGEEPQWAEPPGGDGILGLSEVGKEQQKTQRETVDGDPGEDVNLLTVMLGAADDQSVAEETGELWCWQPPLLSTGSGNRPARLGGELADRQTDSPDLLQVALLLTLPDCGQTDTHYFQRHTNWTEEEKEEDEDEEEEEEEDEDEDEDEECSGYMRR